MEAIYLYAVVAGQSTHDVGSIGLPDGTTPVFSVAGNGLSAIVSRYNGAPFTDLPRAEVLTRLLIHQQVLEHITASSPVLPIKFGSMLDSTDEVIALLARYHSRLIAALEDVGDSVEIDLSATWDVDAVLQEIAREPALAQLAASAEGSSSEETLGTRVQIGKLAQEILERRREELRRRLVGDLVRYTRDAEPNPIPSDDVVLNVAFLVERAELRAFEGAVDRLGDELGDRLTFRYVGPLPPYSFATVEIARPNSDEIEAARVMLGLPEQATRAELRAAYRRLAAELHPDRAPNDPTAPERFTALANARDTLEHYFGGQQTSTEEVKDHSSYYLGREAVSGALLLQINRTEMEAEAPDHGRHAAGA